MPQAAYLRIADAIRDDIRSGRLAPGAKLPTKRELAEKHAVSTQVIDVAMVLLRAEGWVEGQQGKGVYVAVAPPVG